MDKKETIEHSAELLFSSKGYHATSLRDIAKNAEVNVAMIIYYFKSKENLLLGIIQKLYDASEAIRSEMQIAGQDPQKKIQVFAYKSQQEFTRLINVCKIVIQLQTIDVSLRVNNILRKTKEKHYTAFLLAIDNTDLMEKSPQKKIYLYHSFLGLLLENLMISSETNNQKSTLKIFNFLCSYLTTIIKFNFKTNTSSFSNNKA